MKKNVFKTMLLGLASSSVLFLASCSNDDNSGETNEPIIKADRWVTLSGALMRTNPGDGDGGTVIYSVKREDAMNSEYSINIFDNGTHVKSNRTARLQASEDGNFIYNIQYTGADGGIFNKYLVNGGNNYADSGSPINTASYLGISPRWAKAKEGVGIGVNVGNIQNVFDGTGANATFVRTRGTATVLALDLDNPKILAAEDYELALSAEEEKQGYHIFRLDNPIINRAGNKAYIGTWMRKYAPGTTTQDNTSPRLGTKTIVVDYPSLKNPKIITSTVATGDNSGYRSPMSYLASDGNVYQATHREQAGKGGSQILRINQNNEYDNAYVLNLDTALGVKDSYIETWKYAGNNVGYVIYSIVVDGSRTGGYIAKVDLQAKTAKKIIIPGDSELDYGQYQGIAVLGDEVYFAVTPVSVDGNIYIINSKTDVVTKGAKLINKTGNRYIGAF